MFDLSSGEGFVLPAFHEHALWTIGFEDFHDARKALDPHHVCSQARRGQAPSTRSGLPSVVLSNATFPPTTTVTTLSTPDCRPHFNVVVGQARFNGGTRASK